MNYTPAPTQETGITPPTTPVPAEIFTAKLLVIRPHSGLAGDILVAGLAALAGLEQAGLEQYLADLNLRHLAEGIKLVDRQVNQVGGVGLEVKLPKEHKARHLPDITELFERSSLNPSAVSLALRTFNLLAEAEGAVHGLPWGEVHFHEVGALDSIIDIGLAAALYTDLAPDHFICGPLPVADGVIKCEHGCLPSPAPAVMHLLTGVPVVPFAGQGETVTPTALAFLLAAGARFGPWPPLIIEAQTLAYGTRYFPQIPNGALFVWGSGYDPMKEQVEAVNKNPDCINF